MSNHFFIADTHFYHKKILEYEKELRPFFYIEEMNEALVDNWNKVVIHKKDIVWHLGDVIFGGSAEARILSRLKGDKRLILGNHDNLNTLSQYFNGVYAARKWENGLLTHIPIHPSQLEFRFKFNVHGHTHSKKLSDTKYINVSVEQINLTPISAEELRKKL